MVTMEPLCIPTRRDVIDQVRSGGDMIAAVLPFHYPRALLRAFGIYPVELWGPPHVDPMAGPRHFPEYTCAIVSKASCFLQSRSAGLVDIILIPHTCDSLQGMASVMRDHLDMRAPVLTLYHPRGRRPSDHVFLTRELQRLYDELAAITGRRPSMENLMRAVSTEDAALACFRQLAGNRRGIALGDREFYTLLRSREYLPAEDFIDVSGRAPRGNPDLTGPALMISGIVPEPMTLFDHINRRGAHVVADDLACCSRRRYDPVSGPDPLAGLARQLMSMPPDTTVSTPYAARFDYLLSVIRRHDVRGVLVYNPTFCEPELFYLPMFEKAVKAAGKGFLQVETELSTDIPHTVQNRIDAFIEVLS